MQTNLREPSFPLTSYWALTTKPALVRFALKKLVGPSSLANQEVPFLHCLTFENFWVQQAA
jgi:hypothetical protein